MKFSLVLPTLKRVKALEELINSILHTTDNISEVEICIYIDSDDTDTKTFIDLFDKSKLLIKYTTSSQTIKLSQMWNYAYENLATGDIIMLCADDIRFRTMSWDTIIRREFEKSEDKLILVYGDDGHRGPVIATHSFVHRRWIEVSGYWLPPYFSGDYPDAWIDEVAQNLNRRVYLPNILTEHMHFSFGKSEYDETTKRKQQLESRYNPYELYMSKKEERIHQTMLLNNIIKNPPIQYECISEGGNTIDFNKNRFRLNFLHRK